MSTAAMCGRPGIVAAVAGRLAEQGCNMVGAEQFDDASNDRFVLRVAFRSDAGTALEHLRDARSPVAQAFGMEWSLRDTRQPKKVVLMICKWDHCLGDLLYRYRVGELAMGPVAVVSNHPREVLRTSLLGNIPYHYLPVTNATKVEQEGQIKQVLDATGAELVLLARYMQILSDDLAAFLSGRCINIHHSFLPGFKSAKPYHQVHERGVKMIGATAHYATADLDEGPIIHQDVETFGLSRRARAQGPGHRAACPRRSGSPAPRRRGAAQQLAHGRLPGQQVAELTNGNAMACALSVRTSNRVAATGHLAGSHIPLIESFAWQLCQTSGLGPA